jgi:hypothetical protein
MATEVKAVTVSVSSETANIDEELGTAITDAVVALGGNFATNFDVVSITYLGGGGRTTIQGANNEAKTIKNNRYQVIVQA